MWVTWTISPRTCGVVAALAEVARVAPRPPSRPRDRTGTPIRVSRDLVFICKQRPSLGRVRDCPGPAPRRPSSEVITAVTGSYVNSESKCFSAAIRPDSVPVGGQIAQQAGRMAVVADAGEPLSPQAADLVRRIARVVLDEPADLMAELHAAVSAAADEPLRSEPVLAAEVAASNRAN